MVKNNNRFFSKPIFRTKFGKLYVGKCENLLTSLKFKKIIGKVDLIFTSPPFPLNEKKRYGNLQGEDYLRWLSEFAPIFRKLLAPNGSLVIEVGNAWEAGRPVQSTLPYRSLLAFLDSGRFQLCQEITYYNPARLPSPAQWVTIERIRLKDATTKIWWMAKSDKPVADNRKVLRPYSEQMKRLLRRKTYNAGVRPSEHRISKKGFLKNNGGSIASNLLEYSNTSSNGGYLSFCKEHELMPHPARMPEEIPEFFIKFLTKRGGIVLDPFSGSNTTGYSAEKLKRKWISVEVDEEYAISGVSRFNKKAAIKLLNKI